MNFNWGSVYSELNSVLYVEKEGSSIVIKNLQNSLRIGLTKLILKMLQIIYMGPEQSWKFNIFFQDYSRLDNQK